MDVVDQHDVAPAQSIAAIGRDREDAGDLSRARFRPHGAERRRGLGAAQDERVVWHVADPAERRRDQGGLIESARPESPAMQRHGHKQVGVIRQQPRHLPGDGLGEGDATTIFEAQRNGAGDIAIGDRRADAGMARQALLAGGAARVRTAIISERHVAGRTPWRGEKTHATPTGRAEAMIPRGDRAAAGAARRQGQIGDQAQRGDQTEHSHLSRAVGGGTSRAVDTPEIFDRAARRLRRDRAQPHFADHDFLRAAMLDGIAERLDSVTRSFGSVLDLGCHDGAFVPPPGAAVTRLDAGARFAAAAGGIQADEDQPRFADGAFDLVVSAGVLDSVNDLPGALALVRRALRPDGLFLAAFIGAGSLATLRAVLREAEGDRPAVHIHPQIDVRSAGDLLVRAGFALPVADVETLTARYAGLGRLLGDLRGMGVSNVLRDRRPLRRDTLARAAQAFAGRADRDGRTAERFEIIYLTGWAPAPSQPQPARRGSATTSLSAALNKPSG